MIIEATDEQVLAAAARAIAASRPVGLGFLHFTPADDKSDLKEIKQRMNDRFIDIDYFHGRMVKFFMRRVGVHQPGGINKWHVDDYIRLDYQSWEATYTSYRELFQEKL
jgi:hypothetical protein